MAAAEYYLGSQGAQAMQNQNQQKPYPPQPQQSYYQQPPHPNQQLQQQQYSNTPPPSYSLHASQPSQSSQQMTSYPSQPQYQQYPANGRPASSTPYPVAGPQSFPRPPQPQEQSNSYLGVPLQPYRSHSQPARVHFADEDEYNTDSSDRSYTSSSDDSRRRRHRHRKHRHSHSSYGSDDSLDRDYGRDRTRDRSHHEGRKTRAGHKDRDTFLGAGAGGLVGDLIFPGLGTAAGLLLGGYGGRKHAKKRSVSDAGTAREREHDHHDHAYHDYGHRGRSAAAGSGWDPESATFKKGTAVR